MQVLTGLTQAEVLTIDRASPCLSHSVLGSASQMPRTKHRAACPFVTWHGLPACLGQTSAGQAQRTRTQWRCKCRLRGSGARQ